MATSKKKKKAQSKSKAKSASKKAGPSKRKAKSKVKAKTKTKSKTLPKTKSAVPKKTSKAKAAKKSLKASTKTAGARKKSQLKAKKAKAISNVKKASVSLNSQWQDFFTPLEDRLIIHVQGPSEKTAGGIIIPGTVSERPNQGKVLAVGRGKHSKKGKLRPMDVKVGDSVLFSSFAGMKMQLQDQEVLILREEDLLGVVD